MPFGNQAEEMQEPALASPMRVTFITVMPSPYVQDLFACMASDGRFQLQVLYLEQVAPDTYWGPQNMPPYARVLPGRWIGILGARVHVNPTVISALRNTHPDLSVIVGYSGFTNQMAMRWLTLNQKPWVFWGEIPGLQSRNAVGRWMRRLAQSPLKSARGIAAIGSHAVAAYRELLHGNSDIPVRNIPYHCRIDAFEAAGDQRVQSSEIRFLYCGQLIHRKGVDLLCAAFTRLVASGANVRLTLAGDGPLRDELQFSLRPEVATRATFSGFIPVDELPEIFGSHDVFLLPSRHDGWGVVVNQAVAAGMPVIATTEVGAANDLIDEGFNGFLIAPESTDAIFQGMQHFVNHPETVTQFGRRSRERAQTISMDRAMKDWYDFFAAAVSSRSLRSAEDSPP